ncbi:hypothetical protein AB0L40_07155 [Patulibacter sp. NPDC049589]
MKRVLSVVPVLLVVGAFAGCAKNPPIQETDTPAPLVTTPGSRTP